MTAIIKDATADSNNRLPGLLISIDGPGGVGKSTIAKLVVQALTDHGIPAHPTVEPTRTALGDHIRGGTETYSGMALACLVAGDRHHHLATEILPALRAALQSDRPILIEVATDPDAHPAISLYDGTLDKAPQEAELV